MHTYTKYQFENAIFNSKSEIYIAICSLLQTIIIKKLLKLLKYRLSAIFQWQQKSTLVQV